METQKCSASSFGFLRNEYQGARLGDARLERRLLSIVDRVAAKPSESFPLIFAEEAELEGFYRFVGNSSVQSENILEPHYRQTLKRVEKTSLVLAIHDSSPQQFQRTNKDCDIGIIGTNKKRNVKDVGFLGHFSIAVSAEQGEPLGVVNVINIRRQAAKKKKRKKGPRKSKDHAKFESNKWIEGIRETRRKLGACANLIHVMDREADFYTLMGDLVNSSERFVIRAAHDRKIHCEDKALFTSNVLSGAAVICERTVTISTRPQARGTGSRKRYPARKRRKAVLSIKAATVNIKKSEWAPKDHPELLTVNVVHVTELNPPKGETPVDWKLLTTEPTVDAEQILKIVDIYRRRWVIEELFKAFKTGCSYEDRQLESFKTVTNAMAILLPIAWQMLVLRYHSRQKSVTPAVRILTQSQLAILISISKGKLTPVSSTKDVFYAVAKLGGHIKNNGEPGWLVIYRGLKELRSLDRGANLNLTQCNM